MCAICDTLNRKDTRCPLVSPMIFEVSSPEATACLHHDGGQTCSISVLFYEDNARITWQVHSEYEKNNHWDSIEDAINANYPKTRELAQALCNISRRQHG